MPGWSCGGGLQGEDLQIGDGSYKAGCYESISQRLRSIDMIKVW